MKKLFIALSVLAVLALGVVPSQALIGMPDDVPGGNLIQAFFIVEVDGGLDTAVVIQEVGNTGIQGVMDRTVTPPVVTTPAGTIHWHMWTVSSAHIADDVVPYTRNDVVPLSIRSLILANVTPAGLALLRDDTTFGVPVYMGYMTYENAARTPRGAVGYGDNLIGKMYLHNMAAGQASCVNIAAREYMPEFIPGAPPVPIFAIPYLPVQGMTGTTTNTAGDVFAEFGVPVAPVAQPRFEAFSPNSQAISAQLERSYQAMVPTPFSQVRHATGFALYPRYYVHNATAEDFIFIWKSINATAGSTWRIDLNFFDEEENAISGFMTIARELNVIDVRQHVPPSFLATYPAAGWMNIQIPDIFAGIPAAVTQPAQITVAGVLVNNPYWNDVFGLYQAPTAAEIAFSGVSDVEFLAYNWQYADSAVGALNWSGLFEVARDVNYATR